MWWTRAPWPKYRSDDNPRPVPRVVLLAATGKDAGTVQHPKTLIEFMELYPTEEACWEALFGIAGRRASAARAAATQLSQ